MKDAIKKKESRKKAPSTSSDTVDVAASGSSSWGSVFAAAAHLVPAEGLGEDFLQQTSATDGSQVNSGLAKISQIAAAAAAAAKAAPKDGADSRAKDSSSSSSSEKSDKEASSRPTISRKRRRSDENSQSDSSSSSSEASTPAEPLSLEGRMVAHPHNAEEQVMILVDSKRNLVYSAMERTPSGDYIRVGTLKDGEIVWDDNALASRENIPGEQKESPADIGPASFPFPTEADDHCESPLEAYQDVAPLLEKLCSDKNKSNLRIYDPYYCNGAVKRNLSELGFTNVHNVKEDCYQVWSTGVGYPDFDVLITNPPYSEDHIEKLLKHVTSRNFGNRPWFLLLPTWVHKKDNYKQLTSNLKPFYLVPRKRYTYLPPKQFREKKASDVHKKSSPFVSMWYIWGGTSAKNEELIAHYTETFGTNMNGTCDLARSKSALRDLRRKGNRKKSRQ